MTTGSTIRLLPDARSSLDALRPFAPIRLIVLDIDGTLLTGSTPRVEAQLLGLHRTLSNTYSVRVTLATGRALAGAARVIEDLGVTSPVILYNGAIVADPSGSRVFSRRVLLPEAIERGLALALDGGATVLAYNCRPSPVQRTLIEPESSGPGLVETVTGWTAQDRFPTDPNGLRIDWQSLHSPGTPTEATALLVSLPESDSQIQSSFVSLSSASVTASGSQFLEVRPSGVSKAVGLRYLSTYLNLPPESILAVGDNDNDAEMFAQAGIAVAVSGATCLALQSSDYVASKPAAAGVLETLRLVVEARRIEKRGGYRFTDPA